MAPKVGLEPTTHRLTADCSTIELLWNQVAYALSRVTGVNFSRCSEFCNKKTGRKCNLLKTRYVAGRRFICGKSLSLRRV